MNLVGPRSVEFRDKNVALQVGIYELHTLYQQPVILTRIIFCIMSDSSVK